MHRKCVVKVMLLLIKSIFRCRTVNLNKCKTEAGAILGRKDLKLHNIYTRFIRFFKIKSIDAFCIGITWLLIYLIGKFVSAACASLIWLYTAELYPTNLRSQALGICSMMGR